MIVNLKKRALCLSGGGAFGAYQVGVIKALTENGVTWDAVAGISVGAINGLQIASFSPGMHKTAAKQLEVFWMDIKGNDSVYKPWLPWKLNYVASLWKGSLNSTKPLEKLLKDNFNPSLFTVSTTEFSVGTVGLRSGEYVSVNLKRPENAKNILSWVLGSASNPLFLNPVKLNGDLWIDGGVERQIPFNDLLSIPGISEIDVVLTGPIGYRSTDDTTNFNNILNIGIRCIGLVSDQIFDDGLDFKSLEEKLGIKINVFAPRTPFLYNAFDFDPERTGAAIASGYIDTINKLKVSS